MGICLIVGDNCWKRQLIPHMLESRKEKQERRGTEGKFLVFLFSDWVKERFLEAFIVFLKREVGKGCQYFSCSKRGFGNLSALFLFSPLQERFIAIR